MRVVISVHKLQPCVINSLEQVISRDKEVDPVIKGIEAMAKLCITTPERSGRSQATSSDVGRRG